MKIGYLIRALQLSTDAPSGPPSGHAKFGESLIKPNHLVDPKANYQCASACFFVYVSGIYRTLNWVGRLGVHRPTSFESSFKPLSGNEAIKVDSGIRKMAATYLKEMNVPEKYVDLIYSVPPSEVRWITQEEFDSDLQGFNPALRNLVDARCDPRTSKKIFLMI
jgi:hypothetical protein